MKNGAPPSPRPELRGLPVYEPGRAAPRGAIKLASNENAYGPSPAARKAFHHFSAFERYPDGGASSLRRALSRRLRVRPDHLLIGAGSDEIGDLLARAYLRPGDTVVYPKYTFVRYALSGRACGAKLVESRVAADFSVDIADLARAVRVRGVRMVCLANPNNPTGAYVGREDLRRILDETPRSAVFVLDEAYFEYARLSPDYPDGARFLKSHPNLIVLRTFSKIHGLAALRVGYALAHPSLISELHKVRPPFNVNAPAQSAALAALADERRVRRVAARNASERARLQKAMSGLGFTVYPSAGNFLLADVGMNGRRAFRRLAHLGVIVRPLDAYGLTRHLRVTVGKPSETRRLCRALSRLRTSR
ncbi:histidinol-phosphate transaminase [bacterium]|nr:histidinol-phosphate transaminase [bacterium]